MAQSRKPQSVAFFVLQCPRSACPKLQRATLHQAWADLRGHKILFFLCLFAADSKITNNSPRKGSDLAYGAGFKCIFVIFYNRSRSRDFCGPPKSPEGQTSADPSRAGFICSPSP
jgi:hypothetical protein